MSKSVDRMTKRELLDEGERLLLGSRAALAAKLVVDLRAEVDAARADERGGR